MTRKRSSNQSILNHFKIAVLWSLFALLVVLTMQGCANLFRQEASAPIKYFYIDKTGKKVLDGIGFYGDSFHDGLALVCDEYRDDGDVQPFRYIDRSGKTRFKINAYRAYPFSEGLAAICAKVSGVSGGCAGYIDKQGQWVFAPHFYGYGDSFSDGLALVSTPDWKLRYIDRSGKEHIDASKTFSSYKPRPWHQNLRPFSEGLAMVIIGEDGDPTSRKPWKYGYIDKKGNWKINLSELAGSPFCEGRARRNWSSFIDESGKEQLKLSSEAGNFSEGLCSVADKSATFNSISHYSNGTNHAINGFKKGYCDQNGQMVITPQYEDAGEFSEGLAVVTINGKVGYIDTTGKLVVSPQYAYGGDFSDGVAVVVPFAADKITPELKLWGAPTGKYFARKRVEWTEPEISD